MVTDFYSSHWTSFLSPYLNFATIFALKFDNIVENFVVKSESGLYNGIMLTNLNNNTLNINENGIILNSGDQVLLTSWSFSALRTLTIEFFVNVSNLFSCEN